MDFTIEDFEQQTTTIERDIVPAGVHLMRIVNAEEGPNQYKVSDDNPEGLCLKLRLSTQSGNHKFVFDDIPRHLGWRAKQLAQAVGILAVGGKLSLSPEELHEQTLLVEISHYTSKAGKVSAVVKKYVPASEAATIPVQQKPVAAATRKRVPVSADPNDIPF
jgi:hypothetical protein